MQETILELKNIGKTFLGVNVLRGIDFNLKRGEVHALLGENGAGKSTLIKILSGYHQPDKGGEIFINGKQVTFKNPKDAIKASIHTIYQELTLCSLMSVAENIVIDKQERFKGIMQDKAGYRKLTTEVLERLGQPDISPDATVKDLSIAKRQVVEIAKAISANAQIILMDEPTSSISQEDAERLMEIIRNLRDSGVTIVYISHRLHEIGEIADRITVLRDGDLIDTVEASKTSNQQLISMMVGREMANIYPKAEVELGEVVLKVENLCSDVFEDVSFELKKGEILGIGGLVGAKRTEILETLFGVRKKTSGKIILFGKEYDPKSPKDAIDNGMAFITEDRKKTGLVMCLSVLENINIINANKICSKRGVLNWTKFRATADKYRHTLNIKLANVDQLVSTLSGGNQQKVALSKWLEIKPQIVLFDEPTRGIDIGAKTEIYNIMCDLAKEGIAIIMVSSELPELISVTDEIVVMCEGKMTGKISRNEATQERIMAMAATQHKQGDN